MFDDGDAAVAAFDGMVVVMVVMAPYKFALPCQFGIVIDLHRIIKVNKT